jgi:hypothetical protein
MRDEDTNELWDKQLVAGEPEERRKVLEKAVNIMTREDYRTFCFVSPMTVFGLGPRVKEFKLKQGQAVVTDGINRLKLAE